MKVVRIFGFILLLLVVAYLLWLHSSNPDFINLPGFISLPAAVVIGIAGFLGWFVSWLPARILIWRKNRELLRLHKRLDALEHPDAVYAPVTEGSGEPVIPDRTRSIPATDADLS